MNKIYDIMDVQKYIKRLKFARADMSRATGPFETRDEVINFLNSREFFFGDPFVVKYKDREDENKVKLLLAIGKAESPSITTGTTAVSGATGPDAYELFEINDLKDQFDRLWDALNAEISARTEADEHLQEEIDEVNEAIEIINELIDDFSGTTEYFEEVVGEGWTDYPDNVTITDRIKRDESLAGIVWGRNDDEPYDGRLIETDLKYASGENIVEMIKSVSNTLQGVLFEDNNVTKAVKFRYSPERNILYYTAGTETGEIELSQASVAGWDVDDTNTVELTKTRILDGRDILTADVRVSDDGDNMLVAKGDGLYVSGSEFTNVKNVLNNIKGDLAVLDDGHFPSDYFSGSTTNGSANIQDAILKLDEKLVEDEANHNEDIAAVRGEIAGVAAGANSAITEVNNSLNELDAKVDSGFTKNKVEVLVDDNADHLLLNSSLAEDGHIIYTLSETNIASEDAVNDSISGIQGQIDDLLSGLGDETIARESGDAQLQANINAEASVRSAADTALASDISDLRGGLDDLSNRTDAVEQGVSSVSGNLADLRNEFETFEVSTNQAIDALENNVSKTLTGVTNNANSTVVLTKENNNTVSGDIKISADAKNMLEKLSDGKLFVNNSGVTRANALCDNLSGITDNLKVILNTAEDGHFIARFVGPHVSTAGTYYEAVNTLDSAIVAMGNASKDTDNSFKLEYDSTAQEISLKWEVDGVEKESHIDTSDFVKDSFLESVQIVEHQGERCLEFKFSTSDGQSESIYIPLSDFAVIYQAGDGIDEDEIDDNQVITVKIDTSHVGEKNWLAKSSNGLRVTGITEAIEEAAGNLEDLISSETQSREEEDQAIWEALNQETSARTDSDNELREILIQESSARTSGDTYLQEEIDNILDVISGVTGETLSEYVRKDEVEDHFDSASTLPVQNKTVTEALNDLREDLDEAIGSLSAFTADTIAVNDLTANTIVTNELTATTANFDNITANTIVTDEISGENADFTNITAQTIYADEYQNLPTATTSQYGVVVVDDHLDSASTNPVENSVVANAVDGINDEIDDLKEQISAITDSGLYEVRVTGTGNVLTNISKDGTAVVGTLGNIDVKTFAGQELLGVGEVVKTLHVGPYDGRIQIAFKGNTNNEFPVFSALVTIPDHNFAALIEADEDNAVAFDYSDGEKGWVDTLCKVTADRVGWNGYGLEINWPESSTIGWSGDINITPLSGNLNLDRIDEDYSAMYPTDLEYQQKVVRYEKADNKVVEITSASTNNQYPSAKAVYDAVSNVEIDVDDHLDSASTNPVENRVVTGAISDKADKSELDDAVDDINNEIDDLRNQISAITDTGLYDVEVIGSGNVVTSIEKDGSSVVATLGSIVFDVDDELDSASTNPVENKVLYQIIADNEETIAAAFNDLNNRKADLSDIEENYYNKTEVDELIDNIDLTDITANTIYASEYQNLPTATTDQYGVVILDDHLDTGSTNPVENAVVASAFNNVNDEIDDLKEQISAITDTGLYDVEVIGSGNVVTSISKSGTTVVGTLGSIDSDTIFEVRPEGDDSTTLSEIVNAVAAGKIPMILGEETYHLNYLLDGDYASFTSFSEGDASGWRIDSDDTWTSNGIVVEDANNRVSSITSASTNVQYPGAKCVYDSIKGLRDDLVINYGSPLSGVVPNAAFCRMVYNQFPQGIPQPPYYAPYNYPEIYLHLQDYSPNDEMSLYSGIYDYFDWEEHTQHTYVIWARAYTFDEEWDCGFYELEGKLTIDDILDSGSTNPVANSAITKNFTRIERVTAEALNDLNNTKYTKPANGIPASDLANGVIPDVSQFVTRSVNDLANYYLKSEVNSLVGDIPFESGTGAGSAVLKGVSGSATADAAVCEGVSDQTYGNIVAGARASHVEGVATQSKANGQAAHAEGLQTVVGRTNAEVAAAIQTYTNVSGSVAEKQQKLSGYAAHAEGHASQALGGSSHAEGYNTRANVNATHAEGDSTSASGEASHAEGYNTQASGNQSHAEGASTTAIGKQSHAEGNTTSASGDSSHAEGTYTVTQNSGEHAEGRFNKSNKSSNTFGDAGNTLHSIGMGSDSARTNAFEVMQNGDAYLYGVGGYDGTNPGESGVASIQDHFGEYLKKKNSPFAVGAGMQSAFQKNPNYPNTASGDSSVVLGESSTTSGRASFSAGSGNTASGHSSITLGYGNTASGDQAVAMGRDNTASKKAAIATGQETEAAGQASHTEGYKTLTTTGATASHAEGRETVASGYASHAEGWSTNASNRSEHAEGQYNKSNTASSTYGNGGNTQHSIGIGTSNDARKNALEIMQNGDVYVKGIGAYDGTNPSSADTIQDVINDKADISYVNSAIQSITLDDVLDGSTRKLSDYLPLSGGVLTGGLSGTTVSADTFNAQSGFFQTSDERLKIFMGDIENALDKSNSIPTRYFYWKDMCDGPRHIGTSAQKVQEVFPEVVKEENNKLSVDYAKLSIVALAAIKELTAKVEELQKQIDELKK